MQEGPRHPPGGIDRTLPAPPRHPPGGPGRGKRWRRGVRLLLVSLRGLAWVVLGVLEWLAGVVAEVAGAVLGGRGSGE
ncbi:MAG: hypothetical protein OXT07_03385 [bacterium]|nr:hypothetical protein [bacterium]